MQLRPGQGIRPASPTDSLGRRRLRVVALPPEWLAIDGKDLPDHEGTVLANADEARAEAIMLSGAMLKESASTFWNNGAWQMRVVDEAGDKVLFG